MSHRPLFTAVAAVAVAAATGTAALVGAGSAQAAPSATDSTFITANAQTNLAEMALGQVVLQRSSNSAAASARERSAVSVIRSWRSAATALRSPASSAAARPISGFLGASEYSVTRSIRCTTRPQLRAMSVAFEAHGEIVPRRGATTIVAPPPRARAGSP